MNINRAELKESLNQGVSVITFIKKDGTERTMICTLCADFIPEEHRPTGENKPTEELPTIQKVYDVENNGWRSFRWDSLVIAEGRVFKN